MNKEAQNTIEHIVFLGESGFPYGLAAIQRMTLMAKALLNAGLKVMVICRKGVWPKTDRPILEKLGNFEGIDYKYTSESLYRPEGFFNRNVQKLKGLLNEFRYLRYLKKKNKIDVAIISDMSLIHLTRYLVYSRLLSFRVVLNHVEKASAMQDRTSFLTKINDYLVDTVIIKFFDGAMSISDELVNHYKAVSPSKPCLKLPILCDFQKFDIAEKSPEEPYFLYCGSMAYKKVIDFIVEAYRSIPENKNAKLYMIVSGGKEEASALLEKKVNTLFDDLSIKLFSNIPYAQLVDLYVNAIALLIPLRPTLQDAARFPHKIGEYLASGNPIITTNFGEIKNYFEDEKTALVADSYEISGFSKKMKYVLDFPKKAKHIGLNGKKMGLRSFDFKVHGERMRNFLQRL